MKKLTAAFLLAFFIMGSARADVKLARIFSSNMVLQQGLNNPVWGWADKGEKITVLFAGKTITTKAGKDGKWQVKLPAMDYGGPYTLLVEGKNQLKLENILIGEVWVCSGQSNMEWVVANSNNGTREMAAANYPNLRMFTVPQKVAQHPVEDVDGGEWEVCSPETVGHFSAVGYFYARKLQKELDVPIGMIHTSWGGTVAETWISPQNIEKDPDFAAALAELKQMDLNQYRQQRMEKMAALFGGELPSKDTGLQDGKAVFVSADLADHDWTTLPVPQLWEAAGYPDVDGVAWYRTKINLTKAQAEQAAELHLGKVDDTDMTWVNGRLAGQTSRYDLDRIYPLEPGTLKEGENVVAVRVVDTGGGGGIYGEPAELLLKVGGEKIELAGDWKFKMTEVAVGSLELGPNSYPTLLYNGMLEPLIPYGIKGAIWYQGESNADRAVQYRRVFQTLIKDWRQQWGLGDFPFFWVQLANYMQPADQPGESAWAELREAQTMALELPNTGQALAIDIGEANDIHPRNKQDVGRRLALNALKVTYGKEVVHSGPVYESMEVDGNQVIIHFKETGSGLLAKDKYGYLKAFAIAGTDKQFYWAKGEIRDSKSVVVYSDEVEKPVAVRFGWADNPHDLNLYNREGLPAVPFRTDTWDGITK